MNINLNNIILKKETFDFDNVVINNNINKEFINIDYRNKYYFIEGLFFETEWTKLLTNYFIIEKNNKYLIELPFIENNILYKIIKKIDIHFNKYIMNLNNYNIFINSIKNNTIPRYDFYYDYIKLKLNLNNCKIYIDDKEFNNSFEDLDFEKFMIKFQISTHGIWKYNNKYGFSWRIIKIFLKTNETNNIQYFINKKYIKENNDLKIYNTKVEHIDKKDESNDEYLNFKIPNFELEFDM